MFFFYIWHVKYCIIIHRNIKHSIFMYLLSSVPFDDGKKVSMWHNWKKSENSDNIILTSENLFQNLSVGSIWLMFRFTTMPRPMFELKIQYLYQKKLKCHMETFLKNMIFFKNIHMKCKIKDIELVHSIVISFIWFILILILIYTWIIKVRQPNLVIFRHMETKNQNLIIWPNLPI